MSRKIGKIIIDTLPFVLGIFAGHYLGCLVTGEPFSVNVPSILFSAVLIEAYTELRKFISEIGK